MAIEQFARQLAGAYRCFCVIATGCVRQNGVFVGWQNIQNVGFVGILSHVGATYRDSDDFCATGLNGGPTGLNGGLCLIVVLVFAGAYKQSGVIVASGDVEGI